MYRLKLTKNNSVESASLCVCVWGGGGMYADILLNFHIYGK